MRLCATILCLFMAAPQISDQAREARQAEWAAALQGASNATEAPVENDLPQPLQEALRRWTGDEDTNESDFESA